MIVALLFAVTCPALVLDVHHQAFLSWDGLSVTPEFETAPGDYRYQKGTSRCLYVHEYVDAKGRRARHTLELRLRDGEVFHRTERLPEKGGDREAR